MIRDAKRSIRSARPVRTMKVAVAFVSVALVASCTARSHQSPADGTDSATHWLRRCEDNSECGGLQCLCGLCTASCSSDADCREAGAGATCRLSAGRDCTAERAFRVCVVECVVDADCDKSGSGLECVAGQCFPGQGASGVGGEGGGTAGEGGGGTAGEGGGGTAGEGGGGTGANAGTGGEEGSCQVNGRVYPSGSSDIPAPDGCNTCTCDNGVLVCTEMACVVEPTGVIELYLVDREGWREDAPAVDELALSVVGDSMLDDGDILSYDWGDHVMRVSEKVGERWVNAGLLEPDLLFAMEPVLFLLFVDGDPVFPVVLWPAHYSSMPPYSEVYLTAAQGHIELRFHLIRGPGYDLNDARFYRALWKTQSLLDPASGEGSCSADGVRYPDGIVNIQDPFSCNLCVCQNGGNLACDAMYCPVEQTEYQEIVNGHCKEHVSFDNPAFRFPTTNPAFRNGIIYLDCGAAVDGPAYYFDEASGALISTCGGACMTPDPEQQEICRTLCPPPGW